MNAWPPGPTSAITTSELQVCEKLLIVTFTLPGVFEIVPVIPMTVIAEGYGDAVAGSGCAGIVIGVVFVKTAVVDSGAGLS